MELKKEQRKLIIMIKPASILTPHSASGVFMAYYVINTYIFPAVEG
jgi:hypothetical protein